MRMQNLPKNVRIAVAVSGGVDSVVLLHKMRSLQDSMGWSLSVVHCEHGIRGEESLLDRDFVQALAKRWGLECYLFSADCPTLAKERKISLETAAREFRYECFQSLLDGGAVDFVALAHHLDDAAETTLFRLCRGAALRGAVGLFADREGYIRPLLDESKTEILEYAAAHGLEYRTDKTNFEKDATRNVLRLDVMPALERAIPDAARSIAQFAALAKEDDDYLSLEAEKLLLKEPQKGGDSGWRVRFGEPVLFRRACLFALEKLGLEKDYTAKHLWALQNLCGLQTGAKAVLPQGIVAVRGYENIAFLLGEEERNPLPEIPFAIGKFVWGRYVINISNSDMGGSFLKADLEKIPDGAVIRSRKEGDVFRKFGGGEKTLKKFFIDRKIPALERDGLPILAIGNEVLAVLGVEISENVKVTEKTKNTVYFRIEGECK